MIWFVTYLQARRILYNLINMQKDSSKRIIINNSAQPLIPKENQSPYSSPVAQDQYREDSREMKILAYPQVQIEPGMTIDVDPKEGIEQNLQRRARNGFIRKTYSLVALQLLLTVGLCFISFYSPAFLHFQVQNYWLLWVCLGIMLVIEISVFCCPVGRQHPYNLILLFTFTIVFSYIVSFICAYVASTSGSSIVIVAALMTLGLVLALTLYALVTPADFNLLWGFAISVLIAMILLGIFSWIAWTPFLHTLYCALGVILFGIYLVIDTHLIVGGNRKIRLSMDDYVVGALLIYIDIIEIFLFILMLLGGGRR